MRFAHRDAEAHDLPRIVDIYNHAVLTRESTCDIKPISVESRVEWLNKHYRSPRPVWVAVDADTPDAPAAGYLAFGYFMNEREGYLVTADLAIYLHPDYHRKGLGRYLLDEAIRHAPLLGIEVLATTIFASNAASNKLFEQAGFVTWGRMPRVARLGDVEQDLVMVGRRLVPG